NRTRDLFHAKEARSRCATAPSARADREELGKGIKGTPDTAPDVVRWDHAGAGSRVSECVVARD
ncbi:MAG: hypothetical protein WA809_02095, partial [Candidatus Dormiibacterota bacterium]